jgi:hypothetical protein
VITFENAFLMFLGMKLGVGHTEVMDWSWWAVCAPLIVGVIFGLVTALVRD